MKHFFKFTAVFLCLIALTGCYKFNVNMIVNDDKSLNLSLRVAVDMEAMNSLGGNTELSPNIKDDDNNSSMFESLPSISPSVKLPDINDVTENNGDETDDSQGGLETNFDEEKLKQAGFDVKEYKEGNWEGYTITKKFASIDEVTSPTKLEKVDLNALLGDEETGEILKYYFYKDGKNYVADFVFDMTMDDATSMEGVDQSTLDSMFDMSYTIVLPQASVSNNATSVSSDGKTLTWNFKYGQENRVQFAFSFPGENGATNNSDGGIVGFIKDNMLIVGVVAIFLILVIILIIVFTKQKKTPTNAGMNNNQQSAVTPIVEPVVPVQQSVTNVSSPVGVVPGSPQPVTLDAPVGAVPVTPQVAQTPVAPQPVTQEVSIGAVPVTPQVTETPVVPQPVTQEVPVGAVPVTPQVTETPVVPQPVTQEVPVGTVPVTPQVVETPAAPQPVTQEVPVGAVPVTPQVVETPAAPQPVTQEVPVGVVPVTPQVAETPVEIPVVVPTDPNQNNNL